VPKTLAFKLIIITSVHSIQTKTLRLLASPWFFRIILGLFAIQSIWIAISAAYPMVFDENTQFGVIQLYAHHLSPIWAHQPPHADFAGPLAREPSYLYQYLMSFPYRLLTQLTSSQMTQIICLRFIDIALFGWALVVFRRLLFKTKVSPAIIHVALLFFVLTPVVPLLAGQINYDNLVMPIAALTLLQAITIHERLREAEVPLGRISLLLALCMFGSLVQFEFLPIFVAVAVWLGWSIWQQKRTGGIRLRAGLASNWRQTPGLKKAVFTLPLLVMTGLFIQMYGVNIVKYHNPTPACNQVLSDQNCAAYAAWERDQVALAHKTAVNPDPARYGASWTYRMFIALFYTSSGGASSSAYYLSVNPLPVVFVTALAVCLIGVILVVIYHRQVFRRYKYLGFLLFVCLVYAGMLWLRNYADFLHVGQKIAINGRYILPVALPAMLLIALAYRQLLLDKQGLKVGLVAIVFVLFLQGGGALTYITASNSNWYWHNSTVSRLNSLAQRITSPLIITKTPIKSFGRL
jgi:hypothetical protein